MGKNLSGTTIIEMPEASPILSTECNAESWLLTVKHYAAASYQHTTSHRTIPYANNFIASVLFIFVVVCFFFL